MLALLTVSLLAGSPVADQRSGQLVKSEMRPQRTCCCRAEENKEAALGFPRLEDWILHTRSVAGSEVRGGSQNGELSLSLKI